jgi:hypothetical protein
MKITGVREFNGLQTPPEPLQVGFPGEEATPVGAERFIDAVRQLETTVLDRNDRLFDR